MKPTSIFLLAIAAFALLTARAFSASDPQPASAAAPGSYETAELKVLKVFSAKDGESIFLAYLVEWKGQEVIVDDTLAKTNYRAGDMITVLVMKQPYPQGKAAYGLLHFTVTPQKVKGPNNSPEPTPIAVH